MVIKPLEQFKHFFYCPTPLTRKVDIQHHLSTLRLLNQWSPAGIGTCITVLNFNNFQFEYISPHFRQCLGKNVEREMREHGMTGLFRFIHQQDKLILSQKVWPVIARALAGMSPEEKLRSKSHYNFRIKKTDGTFAHFYQTSVFLALDELGIPILKLDILTEMGATIIRDHIIEVSLATLQEKDSYRTVCRESFHYALNLDVLSKRELQVIKLVAKGCSSKQVALDLFISKNTVDTHRRKILKKLQMKSMVEVVYCCQQNGLI